MAELAVALPLALQVGGQLLAGRQARAAGEYEATQAYINAGQAQAAGQRKAQEEQRRSRLAQSRALAVAAASGGGASDRTVADIIADLAAEGDYRSRLAMYEGDDKARLLRARGDAAKYEGKAAQRTSYLRAATSIAGAGGTLYEKYGGGGIGYGTAGSEDPDPGNIYGMPY